MNRIKSGQIEWWLWLLALLPVLAICSIYLEAFVASRLLGHWPVPSLEDPKALPTAWFHLASFVMLVSVLPGATLFLVVLLKNWRVLLRPSIYWLCLLTFLFSFALFLLLPRFDHRTFDWWMD